MAAIIQPPAMVQQTIKTSDSLITKQHVFIKRY